MKLQIRALLVACAALVLIAGVYADSETPNAGAKEALLKADAAWSKAVGAESKDAFYATFLSDAVMLAPHHPAAEGTEAIRAMMEEMFALPEFSVAWKPGSAKIAASGDMGYTTGTYQLSFNDPDGNQVVDDGKYLTVWKKQADGTWKVAADMFNTNLPH